MNNPKVSVIIPCYNQGIYIDEAVDSLLAQTFQDFEIVIINDGSTDEETNRILASYNKPKTRVITTKNQGLASARNEGIKVALGEYIFPLDADNKIAPSYLEKAITILDNNIRVGMVYSLAEFFGMKKGLWDLPEYNFPAILVKNSIHCSALFRKTDWEKAGGYNPNMKYGKEDRDFWLSIIELGKEPYRIDEILFQYRIKGKTNWNERMTDYQRIYSYLMLFNNHKWLYLRNLPYVVINLALETIKFKFGRLVI
jgi:glycosyltransferase involved in cell wall biosynthesis